VAKKVKSHDASDPKTIFNPVLFWDAGGVDPVRNAGYVISRVMNFGDWHDIEKLYTLYPISKLIETVKKNRGLLPQAGKYWAIHFNIPLREVACLKKYYQ
jgi:hypothetical protein